MEKMQTQISACLILYKSARENANIFIQNKNKSEVKKGIQMYEQFSYNNKGKYKFKLE